MENQLKKQSGLKQKRQLRIKHTGTEQNNVGKKQTGNKQNK